MNLKFTLILIIIVIISVIGYFTVFEKSQENKILEENFNGSINSASGNNMIITSSAFKHNEFIPSKYTCDGENINPPLEINGVPAEAKSLVLIMDDPDAPLGTWVHWTVWNIDPKTARIAEKSVPSGAIEGQTSFGKPGYGGPCPPSGAHRYFFKVYALDIVLDFSSGTDKAVLEKAMTGHILDKAELIGLYSRK